MARVQDKGVQLPCPLSPDRPEVVHDWRVLYLATRCPLRLVVHYHLPRQHLVPKHPAPHRLAPPAASAWLAVLHLMCFRMASCPSQQRQVCSCIPPPAATLSHRTHPLPLPRPSQEHAMPVACFCSLVSGSSLLLLCSMLGFILGDLEAVLPAINVPPLLRQDVESAYNSTGGEMRIWV